jgi:hypothetical protein
VRQLEVFSLVIRGKLILSIERVLKKEWGFRGSDGEAKETPIA